MKGILNRCEGRQLKKTVFLGKTCLPLIARMVTDYAMWESHL